MKRLLIATIILLLWASPAMAITLDELPEFRYEIGQIEMIADESEPEPEKQGFWASREPWTKKDKYLQATSIVLQILDWRQTLLIDNYGLMESNPILGPHPTDKEINKYFPCYIGTTILITHILPQKYRKYWMSCCIGESLRCLKMGYDLGIKIKF